MALLVSCSAAFLLCSQAAAAPHRPVWPSPREMAASGGPVGLAGDFAAVHPAAAASDTTQAEAAGHSRLARAVERFGLLMAPARTAAARRAATSSAVGSRVLRSLDLHVIDFSDELGIDTDSSYTLTISHGQAAARAETIYGAMYAMETFAQLVDVESGMLSAENVTVTDAPSYAWRGLMIDTGRRFATVDLLHNLIDTMAAVKLNVMHMHLSDFCRFAVESKLYPNLTGIYKFETDDFRFSAVKNDDFLSIFCCEK